MPSTISSPTATPCSPARARSAMRPDRIRARRTGSGDGKRAPLGHYVDRHGRAREIVVLAGLKASVLVVDRDAASREDDRLVAHLAADEPRENAAIVCGSYLDQVRRGASRCRAVMPADFTTSPFPELDDEPMEEGACLDASVPIDPAQASYRLEPVPAAMSIPELRWRRHAQSPAGEPHTVSMREAIASLESYEPIRSLTMRALRLGSDQRGLSTAVLRAELARVQLSPIVLNRGLREVVVARTQREGLSLSEIATRCGRVKRDAGGGESGETSWLARRLGLMPEGGKDKPTPWIHTDVLALIARRGLGMSPREVEVQ
jgi:hypothetical protein